MDLFSTTPEAPPVAQREPSLEQHARELLRMPSQWKLMSWTAYGPSEDRLGVIVEGAVATETFQRGKNKGRINWAKRDRGTEAKIPIPHADHIAWLEAWERETGLCYACRGRKEEWFGWHHETGSKFRPCRRCDATGIVPTQAADGREGRDGS